MLFDLRSGKRRRVVQVVFGTMALLFGVSFLFFGIGSDASGGLADLFGFGTSSQNTGNPQFDEEIEDAETAVEADPKDEKALLELAEVRYQAGQFELEADPDTGQPVVTDEARANFEGALDSWEQYMALEPKKPDAGTAAIMAQAYVQLEDAEGAAEAQRIVAEDNPSGGTYGNLAFYLYASGDIEGGDEAAQLAVENADPAQADQIEKQLAQIGEQAAKLKEAAEKQAEKADEEGSTAGAPIADPFGSIGGTGGLGGTAQAPPPAP
jgi:tetratricopeptide (TPR) repeat protein